MVRHKVYATISTYSNGLFVRETSMNAGHKKIDMIRIFVNADTDNKYDLSINITVRSEKDKVIMEIRGEPKEYILDLTGFNGEIKLTNKQIHRVVSERLVEETVDNKPFLEVLTWNIK